MFPDENEGQRELIGIIEMHPEAGPSTLLWFPRYM